MLNIGICGDSLTIERSLFQAKDSGFKYLGLTAKKSDFFKTGMDKPVQRGKVSDLEGKWKPRSQKHLFIKLINV